MDLKQIETFIHVCEQKSFTRAAQKLGYTQSAVSFQIKQLELSLGVTLFERVNHSIKLTSKGCEVLELAHKMMALSSDIKRISSMNNEISGTVRIAMADSLCHWLFWDNYSSFHQEYPNITLKVISASTEEMFRLAKQNDVDIIFTLDKHIYDENYIIAKQHPVKNHFIVSPEHPLAGMENITFDFLMKYPFILTEKGMSYRRMLEEHLALKSLQINPFLEIGDTDLICHLIEQNMGVSFLPDFVTDSYVKSGKIKRLNTKDFSADIWIQTVYHRSKWLTPEMDCVIHRLCSYI